MTNCQIWSDHYDVKKLNWSRWWSQITLNQNIQPYIRWYRTTYRHTFIHSNGSVDSAALILCTQTIKTKSVLFVVSCSCHCCRDFDARAKNEWYRSMFRLTQDERLDGHTDCTLWTPFAKMHVVGQLFISNNYICFNSREEDLCQLIIPLREVNMLVVNQCQWYNTVLLIYTIATYDLYVKPYIQLLHMRLKHKSSTL